MTPCAYCGHTYAEHAGIRCWGERPGPNGWTCTCPEYVDPGALAEARDEIEPVLETTPTPQTPCPCDWCG